MRYNKLKYGEGVLYETPIFIDDRSTEDVEKAQKINSKIASAGWNGLTAQEQSEFYSNIGVLRAADLNRIENQCSEVADMLRIIGYDNLGIWTKKDWKRQDLPYLNTHMERIRNNVEKMIDAYNHNIQQPVIPHNEKLDVEDINTLEASLKLLDKNIKNIAHCWNQYAGMTYAGGELA